MLSHVVVTSRHNLITACFCHHSRPAPGTPALPAGEGPPTYRFNVHGWRNSGKREKIKTIKKNDVKIGIFWPTSNANSSAAVSNNNFPTSSRDKEPPLVCRNIPWINRTFSVFHHKYEFQMEQCYRREIFETKNKSRRTPLAKCVIGGEDL